MKWFQSPLLSTDISFALKLHIIIIIIIVKPLQGTTFFLRERELLKFIYVLVIY